MIGESILGESPVLNAIYKDSTNLYSGRKTPGEVISSRIPFAGAQNDSRRTLREIIDNGLGTTK